jgi:2-polyprenyl-3-methyl-5-hydroxy-6-metoxy-1,4-benzoquinol methylase
MRAETSPVHGRDTATTAAWPAAERLLSLPAYWSIHRQGDLAWLDPTPDFTWYRNFYNRTYHADRDAVARFDSPVLRDRKLAYFNRRIARIQRHLGRPPGRVLDYGAGDGAFLLAARKAGLEACGVDLSAAAARSAAVYSGAPVLVGDLVHGDVALDGPFDVITMHHVLEHLTRPLDYLAEVRKLLAPDGLFVFEIPQQFINPIDMAYRLLRRRRRFGPYSLHHPYFYRVESIRQLMADGGFRIEKLRTWAQGQIFHVTNPLITTPLQSVLWLSDVLARRGHIIEVFARPQ